MPSTRLVTALDRLVLSATPAYLAIAIVALGRTLLEHAFAAAPRRHPPPAMIENVAFYVALAYALAAVAGLLSRRKRPTVLAAIVAGMVLAWLPPIVDTVSSGIGSGYYYYVQRLEYWRWTLSTPASFSVGETLALWLGIALLAGYVGITTRSLWKVVLALLGAYSTIAVLAVGPGWGVAYLERELFLSEGALPRGGVRGHSSSLLRVLLLLSIAQAAYLIRHPRLLRRLAWRSLHACPVLALAFLGFVLGDASGERPWPAGYLGGACLFVLCIVALVQNDAHDGSQDCHRQTFCEHDDERFFTGIGAILVAAALFWSDYVAAALALFFACSCAYSLPCARLKRIWPVNYAVEGFCGACAVLIGVYCARPNTRPLDATLVAVVIGVFVAWFLFRAVAGLLFTRLAP